MSDVAIEIKNLSKTFYIAEDRKYSLKSLFASFFKQGKTRAFHALEDINLEIYKGEFVGIVGRNGSGKSTLLKLIAGIYSPDRGGKIKVHGRLVPFLELGVGFNPELTGKENIYLNGTILGMSKKYLDEKYDEIVKFAELEEFMEVPVKNYSSGMMVRLAFSIAVQTDADIYILDEILAVGDENFQRKSLSVINRMKREGKTILFVSHSMESIEKFCDRAVLLFDAHVAKVGKPVQVVDEYRRLNNEDTSTVDPTRHGNRWGNRDAEITDVKIMDESGKEVQVFEKETTVRLRMEYKLNKKVPNGIIFGVATHREDGLYLTGTNTLIHNFKVLDQESGVVEYKLHTKYLLDGQYMFTVGVFDAITLQAFDYHTEMYNFEVRLYHKDIGVVSLPCEWTNVK
jgi:ABC-type polysaccharide/polyol phosphate transport system ATPase subunit